ncbi:MAG: hypothetical protein BJ554DRAFT_5692, partial [Olpidium bornovanus]
KTTATVPASSSAIISPIRSERGQGGSATAFSSPDLEAPAVPAAQQRNQPRRFHRVAARVSTAHCQVRPVSCTTFELPSKGFMSATRKSAAKRAQACELQLSAARPAT